MIKIDITPLQGINIQNIGHINLGQSKAEIEKLLGNPSIGSNDKRCFYSNYEFRIDFDENDRIEFIEFIYGPYPEKAELSIYGINPFEIEDAKLIKILTEKNNGKIDDSEGEYSYGFLNISVGIWRESIPKKIEDEINEMKQSGEYEENKEWLEEDLKKTKHFWTIGIGKENYYS